jgi:hypothetical protein
MATKKRAKNQQSAKKPRKKTSSRKTVKKRAPRSPQAGVVIQRSETEYHFIDPTTGGLYILKTRTPKTEEQVLAKIRFAVLQRGTRPQAGQVWAMESRE